MSGGPLRLAYLGFALLGAAVLGAFVYDRAFRPAPPPGAAARVDAPAAAGAPAPTVPAERPRFELKDLDGRVHTLADWDGKGLVVNFWATWCAPCRREIPLLNSIHAESVAKGIEIVGIAVDFADDVRAFIARTPLAYPLLIGEEDGLAAAKSFGVSTMAFPFTAFIDAKGRVLAVHLGELHAPELGAILGIMARLDGGAIGLTEARESIARAFDGRPVGAGASPSD